MSPIHISFKRRPLILKALIASLDGKTVYEGELSGPAKKGVMLGKTLRKPYMKKGANTLWKPLLRRES